MDEINASLQKLLIGNPKCDAAIGDDDNDETDNADGDKIPVCTKRHHII